MAGTSSLEEEKVSFGQSYHGHIILGQIEIMDIPELPVPAHSLFPEVLHPEEFVEGRSMSVFCKRSN